MTQIDWSGILTITCVGFCLVIVMLLLLVFVMKGFGSFFTHQRKKQSPSQTELDEETVAAIMTALKLFGSARHDRETEMLTILSIKRAYSPWNSKISRINSNARLQKISYERLFIENKRKSIRHFD